MLECGVVDARDAIENVLTRFGWEAFWSGKAEQGVGFWLRARRDSADHVTCSKYKTNILDGTNHEVDLNVY